MAHTCQCKLPMKLETLLEDSHLWLATDPRDKVYALYGLASQSTALNENSLTAPDYQKSVVDVFQDLTRYLLLQPYDDQLDHDILSLVARSGDNGKDGFPSWVPRIDRVYDTDGTWMIDKGLVPSWWWQAGTCLPTEIRDSEPSSLIMKGIIVTEVLYTNVFVSEFSSIFPRTDFRDMYRKLWNYWRSGNSQDEEVFKGKFARTLTAGRIRGYSEGEDYPWTASEIDACFAEPNEESDLINKLTFHLRHGWSMIILHGAIFGLSAATNVQKGDVVCVFFGQKVPRVIRPCGDHFTFVGDCYVDDFMFGKATDEWKAGRLKEQWIELR